MGKSTQTKIGWLIEDGEANTSKTIWIKDEARESGMVVRGLSGFGKSSFYESLIFQDALKGAVIVVDPHGDLINHCIAQLPEDEDILERVYLLDITDKTFPFALNAFACQDPTDSSLRTRTRNRVNRMFTKLWPELAERQYYKALMPNLVEAMIENPGMTIKDMRRFLSDEAYRNAKVKHVSNLDVKDFWLNGYNLLPPSEQRKEASILGNRINDILIDPVLKNIVCQPNTTIDLRRAIEEKQIIFVKLPTGLEEYEESSSMVGTILIALLIGVTFSFENIPKRERPGYSLYVDEVQNFATEDFKLFFGQLRKYRSRPVVAHQWLSQITIPALSDAFISAPMQTAFRLNKDDAREMATTFYDKTVKFKPDPIYRDVVKHLPSYHSDNDEEYKAVQHFYKRYIKPLQEVLKRRPDEDGGIEFDFGEGLRRYKADKILKLADLTLETINSFFYTSQKEETANEDLIIDLLSKMGVPFQFVKYHLFTSEGFDPLEYAPEVLTIKEKIETLQKSYDEKIQGIEQEIEALKSFLDDEAFYFYLDSYYRFYYPHPFFHLQKEEKPPKASLLAFLTPHRIRQFSKPVLEEELQNDKSFWQKAVASAKIDKTTYRDRSFIETLLKEQAETHAKLARRSNIEQIIADEKPKIIYKYTIKEKAERAKAVAQLMQNDRKKIKEASIDIWGHIVALYDIKRQRNNSSYSSNMLAFYNQQFAYSLSRWRLNKSGMYVKPIYSEPRIEKVMLSRIVLDSYVVDFDKAHTYDIVKEIYSSVYKFTKDLWEVHIVENYQREIAARENKLLDKKLYEKDFHLLLEAQKAVELEQREKEIRENPAIQEEVKRNAEASELDTIEKILAQRKAELLRHIQHLENELVAKEAATIKRDLEWEKRKLEEARKPYEEEKSRRDAFLVSLIRAAKALIANPLGEEKTYKESDVAYTLERLPPRHIMVKIAGEKEFDPPRMLQLKTLDAPQATVRGKDLDARIQRIREQTRARYCRPVAEVEAFLRRDSQEPGQTPTTRSKGQTRKLDVAELADNLPEEERPARRKPIIPDDETE